MAPIAIDWEQVFDDDHPGGGADVCLTSSSPPPPPRAARVGAAARRGRQKGADGPAAQRGPRTTVGGLHQVCGGGAGRRNQPRAASKAAADDRAAALRSFDWCEEDENSERASRKYCTKISPTQSGKKNYRPLEMSSGGKPRHGDRKSIPVDMMYSSKPCSASFCGHHQRVHAIDPEEVDDDIYFRRSQNHSFSNFAKRRKEQRQSSTSCFIQKVEDVVLLDDEEMQPAEEVDCGTSDKQIESKIYYPSSDDPQAVELSSSDVRCLEPGVYLSSPVINYYIQYTKNTILWKENNFYIFNTYFYSKLEEALVRMSDFLKLRRWWKGVNIFQRSYIILPIHGMAHWSLIIICIPGKESNSGPIILHLDSLGMHSSTKIFGTVKRFLEEEWRHLKKNPPPDTSISDSVWEDLPRNIQTQIVEVPQQNNAYDCGVFMLYYIQRLVIEAPERFTSEKLAMFSRSWFNSELASELRVKIRELLLEEFETVRLDDAISDAASSDGSELGDSSKNDQRLKVAGAEEGSGESGGPDTSNVGTTEVPALDEGPTGSIRHDENVVDCVLSEAASFSDSIKDEDPAQACSDGSKAEEEEWTIVSPDRLKDHEETIMSTPYLEVVSDSDSDSDNVRIMRVRERIASRQNCLII